MNVVIIHSVRNIVTAAVAGLVLAAAVGSAGAAVPDPGPSIGLAPVRSLHRLGTQLVIGDNLTGNGVLAPCWVPELPGAEPGCVTKRDPAVRLDTVVNVR